MGTNVTDTIRCSELPTLLDRYPDTKILSLDCFDTLLWRIGNAPRDVFVDLGIEGGSVERRMRAENVARQTMPDGTSRETAIADIYARLLPNADAETRAAWTARELEAEARHCYAFAPTVALIQDAKARGLKLVVVSDTYLSSCQLRELIAVAAGFHVAEAIDHIFASSEFGMAKAGGLFSPVLEALEVAPGDILHLGDNRIADYVAPQKLGIPALHLEQFDAEAEARLRMEAAAATLVDPRVRVSVPASQPHRPRVALRDGSDPAFALGHDVIGPLFETFAMWVGQEAAALEASHGKPVKSVFLLRDGHLPRLICDALGNVKTATASISRFTARRASFIDSAAVESYLTAELHERVEVHAEQLLLQPGEVKGVGSRAALIAHIAKNDLMPVILRRSAAFAERMCRHIVHEAKVEPGDTVMLVDLGYVGTAQDLIEPVLRARFGGHVAGRYLLLRPHALDGNDKAGLFDTSWLEHRALDSLAAPISVIEQLATTSAGSVVDYEPGGKPVFRAAKIDKAQRDLRSRVQAAAVEFAKRGTTGFHTTPKADDFGARRVAALGVLARLLFFPQAAEVDLLETFAHDVNLGTSDTNRLLDRTAASTEMKRRGLAYLGGIKRMFASGELQPHGLDRMFCPIGVSRFGLDLREADLRGAGVEVPVVFADAHEQLLGSATAWPTSDGYLRLTVPIGQRALTVGVMLGKLAPHVQIERVAHVQQRWIEQRTWDGTMGATEATAIPDGLQPLGGDLYAAAPESMLVVPPPPMAVGAMVVELVFRPISSFSAAADRVAA